MAPNTQSPNNSAVKDYLLLTIPMSKKQFLLIMYIPIAISLAFDKIRNTYFSECSNIKQLRVKDYLPFVKCIKTNQTPLQSQETPKTSTNMASFYKLHCT
jgi:hypothetical protein